MECAAFSQEALRAQMFPWHGRYRQKVWLKFAGGEQQNFAIFVLKSQQSYVYASKIPLLPHSIK